MTQYIPSILVAGRLSSAGSPVSDINKSDHHDLPEMFLNFDIELHIPKPIFLLVLIHWSVLKRELVYK